MQHYLLQQRTSKEPLVINLDKEEVIVGRKDFADVCLSVFVSRKHASFQVAANDEWFLKDLGGQNGTYLNGNRIGKGLHKLNVGDTIGFGVPYAKSETEFEFKFCIRSDELTQALPLKHHGDSAAVALPRAAASATGRKPASVSEASSELSNSDTGSNATSVSGRLSTVTACYSKPRVSTSHKIECIELSSDEDTDSSSIIVRRNVSKAASLSQQSPKHTNYKVKYASILKGKQPVVLLERCDHMLSRSHRRNLSKLKWSSDSDSDSTGVTTVARRKFKRIVSDSTSSSSSSLCSSDEDEPDWSSILGCSQQSRSKNASKYQQKKLKKSNVFSSDDSADDFISSASDNCELPKQIKMEPPNFSPTGFLPNNVSNVELHSVLGKDSHVSSPNSVHRTSADLNAVHVKQEVIDRSEELHQRNPAFSINGASSKTSDVCGNLDSCPIPGMQTGGNNINPNNVIIKQEPDITEYSSMQVKQSSVFQGRTSSKANKKGSVWEMATPDASAGGQNIDRSGDKQLGLSMKCEVRDDCKPSFGESMKEQSSKQLLQPDILMKEKESVHDDRKDDDDDWLGYSQCDEVIIISDDESYLNFPSSQVNVKMEPVDEVENEFLDNDMHDGEAVVATGKLEAVSQVDDIQSIRQELHVPEKVLFKGHYDEPDYECGDDGKMSQESENINNIEKFINNEFCLDRKESSGLACAGEPLEPVSTGEEEDDDDFFPELSQAFYDDDTTEFLDTSPDRQKCDSKQTRNQSLDTGSFYRNTIFNEVPKPAKTRLTEPKPMQHRPRYQRGREEWFEDRYVPNSTAAKPLHKHMEKVKQRSIRETAKQKFPKKKFKKSTKGIKERIKEQMGHRIRAPNGGSAIPMKLCKQVSRSSKTQRTGKVLENQEKRACNAKALPSASRETHQPTKRSASVKKKPENYGSRMGFLIDAESEPKRGRPSKSFKRVTAKKPSEKGIFKIPKIPKLKQVSGTEVSRQHSPLVAADPDKTSYDPSTDKNFPHSALNSHGRNTEKGIQNGNSVGLKILLNNSYDHPKQVCNNSVDFGRRKSADSASSSGYQMHQKRTVPTSASVGMKNQMQQCVQTFQNTSVSTSSRTGAGNSMQNSSVDNLQKTLSQSVHSRHSKDLVSTQKKPQSLPSLASSPNEARPVQDPRVMAKQNPDMRNKPYEKPECSTSQFGRYTCREQNCMQLLPLASKISHRIDSEYLLEEVLKTWNPSWLKEYSSVQKPPPCVAQGVFQLPLQFSSFDHYVTSFYPMVRLELWDSIYEEWSACPDKNICLMVHECTARGDLMSLECESLVDSESGYFPRDGTLLVVDLRIQERLEVVKVFGYVTNCKAMPYDPQKQKLHKEWYRRHEASSTNSVLYKFCLRAKKRSISLQLEMLMKATVISYIANKLRQLDYLQYLIVSPLLRPILQPNEQDFQVTSSKKTLPPAILGDYNDRQSFAIASICEEMNKPYLLPKIVLLQGPPGTGKTHTIVGIIQGLLKDRQNNMKILVAAASNAAVDEIGKRLIKTNKERKRRGLFKDGDSYRVVRVGSQKQIHQDLLPYSLEELTKRNVKSCVIREQEHRIRCLKDKEKLIESLNRCISHLSSSNASVDAINKKRSELQVQMRRAEQLREQIQATEDRLNSEKFVSPKDQYSQKLQLLRKADVILSTLSSSRQRVMETVFHIKTEEHLTCCIVDEATQCTEPDVLQLLVFGICKFILVGDHKQLPATVQSRLAEENCFARSLFERVHEYFHRSNLRSPIIMLNEQYRMHSAICQFPSSHFYSGKLVTSPAVDKKYHSFPLRPFTVLDILHGRESNADSSKTNLPEAQTTIEICKQLLHMLSGHPSVTVGLVTPYQGQRQIYLKEFARHPHCKKVEINTVDGFQGREKDVIIVSCVRACSNSGSIGFLACKKRLNVAITRARQCLIICGHMDSLKQDPDWWALTENAKKWGRYISVTCMQDIPYIMSEIKKRRA